MSANGCRILGSLGCTQHKILRLSWGGRIQRLVLWIGTQMPITENTTWRICQPFLISYYIFIISQSRNSLFSAIVTSQGANFHFHVLWGAGSRFKATRMVCMPVCFWLWFDVARLRLRKKKKLLRPNINHNNQQTYRFFHGFHICSPKLLAATKSAMVFATKSASWSFCVESVGKST